MDATSFIYFECVGILIMLGIIVLRVPDLKFKIATLISIIIVIFSLTYCNMDKPIIDSEPREEGVDYTVPE